MLRTTAAVGLMLLAVTSGSGVSVCAEGTEAFTDHGVAAEVCRSRGATAAVDGDGNRVVLVWLMDHTGSDSLLVIDAETGEAEQIEVGVPVTDAPFSVLHSTRNLWYTQFADRFFEFDPAGRSFSFIGETPVPGSPGAMSMYEDGNGLIWAGMFPNTDLISFNPDTHELVDHGQMNDESWRQYVRNLAMDEAGWIYGGIGAVSGQVAGYNPATAERRTFIDEDDRRTGYGQVRLGVDGKVYARATEGWDWHMLHDGVATPIEEMPVDAAPMRTGSADRVFSDFPDGSRIAELNVPERSLVIEDTDGTRRHLEYDYRSEGARIYTLTRSPDGAIYGSTGHPLRVFRYDGDTGTFTHRGLPGGHLNQMITFGDRLYGANYAVGWLHEIDVHRPWRPGGHDDDNPIALAHAQPHIIRPHVLLGHPDGRHVIMGGTPAYGHTGGGLLIYDTEAREGTAVPHTELLENHSTFSLVALPNGDLVGGTSTTPGTAGVYLATEAELYVFDWERREVVWREPILPGLQTLADMVLGPDGLVYGISAPWREHPSMLFVFDPASRTVVHEESLAQYGRPAGSQAPRSMILGPDEEIYMLFREAIVQLTPGTFEHRRLTDTPVTVQAGVALHEGRLYFSSDSHLWSYQIPAER